MCKVVHWTAWNSPVVSRFVSTMQDPSKHGEIPFCKNILQSCLTFSELIDAIAVRVWKSSIHVTHARYAKVAVLKRWVAAAVMGNGPVYSTPPFWNVCGSGKLFVNKAVAELKRWSGQLYSGSLKPFTCIWIVRERQTLWTTPTFKWTLLFLLNLTLISNNLNFIYLLWDY